MRLPFSIFIFLVVIVFFSVFAVSCASTKFTVPSQGIYIPLDFAGAAHAGDTIANTEFNHLEYAGVKWVLRTFNWVDVEPYKGEWNLHFYDAFVDRHREAGIKVLGTLGYDNWWINEDKSTPRSINSAQLPHYLEYVRKMAEHFKGRVAAWSIWNEPNMKRFWTGTEEEFFELTRQAAAVIREVDPDVIILGGSFNRFLALPKNFIRGFFESGAADSIDFIAFHPYEINPTRTARVYNQFKNIAADYGFDDRIWVTEVGYPTGGLYITKVSEKKFPEYIMKTWILLTASGAKRIIWYQMFDRITRERFESEAFFGLTRSRRDFTSKGVESFRLCANFLSGSTCFSLTQGAEDMHADRMPVITEKIPKSLQAFWFDKKDNGGALVIWNESAGSKKVTIELPGTEHLQHDIVTGETCPISKEIKLRIGKKPIFITW